MLLHLFYKVLTRLLRSWFIMFYTDLICVFARCFTRLLYVFCVFYKFSIRIWKGYYKALQGFYKAFIQLSQGVYKVFKDFFIRCPRVCLQCFFKGFDNVLYKAFTMLWQGFYKVFQCSYKVCTTIWIVFTRLLQVFCKAFTRYLHCVLQGFYKLFTRFLQCALLDSLESVDAMKSTGIISPWSWSFFILLDLFPTWYIYQKIPSNTLTSLIRLLNYIYICSWNITRRWSADAQYHTIPFCVQHFGSMFEIL